MKKYACLLFLVLNFSCQSSLDNLVSVNNQVISQKAFFNLPKDLPQPLIPVNNLLTDEKIDLGRHLFYEKKLSVNNKFSCGTCHLQEKAFTDGKKIAEGTLGDKHSKNSMSLTNIGYSSVLTWGNPNLHRLELQMLLAMFGESPPELAMSGRENELFDRLKNDPLYQDKFSKAFPNQQDPINLQNLTNAIASFERTLVSFNSPYDKFLYQKDKSAISDSAKRGERLFYSEKLECFHCHGGFNFTDSTTHDKSTFIESSFHNTGLYNLNNRGDYPKDGQGVFDVSQNINDMGSFKAPTLRNIELTAPYMHDGSIETLEEVIEHYAKGGRTISTGEYKGIGSENIHKNGFIKGFIISEDEKKDVIEFLKSLTDRDFVTNKKFSDPFPSPNITD